MSDDSVDYSRYTEAELLEIASNIDPRRAGHNFLRLKSQLEARGYLVTVPDHGPVELALTANASRPLLNAPIRFGERIGLLAWMEPARNDFGFVGSGNIRVGQATVEVEGRRLMFLLGLPLVQNVTLDRERITNVETIANKVRLEYRETASGRSEALSFSVENEEVAAALAKLLPQSRASDFRPSLQAELHFDDDMLRRARSVPVTTALVLINVLVFLAMVASSAGSSTGQLQINWGSNFGPYTTDGEWWRVLTSLFVHFGIIHLAFNMWVLAGCGPLVERLYGSIRYLFVYLVAGTAGTLLSIWRHPSVNSAGASGAIFGVYGALLAAMLASGGHVPGSVVRPLRNSAIVFCVYALTAGLVSAGVDNAAHVGGLVSGFLVGLAIFDGTPQRKGRWWRTSRLVGGVIVGAALLGAGGVLAESQASALGSDRLFWRTQHWIARNERNADRAWTEIILAANEGKLDDPGIAEAIQSRVLPVWREADRRLAAVSLRPGSPAKPALAHVKQVVEARVSAYSQCAEAARKHDSSAFAGCLWQLPR